MTYWRMDPQSGDFDGEDINQTFVRLTIPSDVVNQVIQGEAVEDWAAHSVRAIADSEPTTDFLFGSELLPIVSGRFKSILNQHGLSDIDYYPLDVNGAGFSPVRYWVANCRTVIDCIDRSRSHCEVWTKETLYLWEKRPWLLGQFRDVRRAVLDPIKVGEARLFRLWGCAIVAVNDSLKMILENEGLSGINFWPLDRDLLGID